MNNYCIYKHTNKMNGKVYIGQTCQKPEYRWGKNGNNYYGSPRFYSAIQSYGWDNFDHEILFTNLTADQANELEEKIIKEYNSNNELYGYNLDGGGKNKIVSDETKQKQSESALQRKPVTDDTKKKLSIVNKNKPKDKNFCDKISKASFLREEEKRKLGIKKFRKVKCINTGVIFNSCREAANWCGLAGTSGIASVCRKGKQKTAGVHPITKEKLLWEYVE